MSEDQAGDIESIEQELDTHMLKRRSIVGALAFTGRTALLQVVGLVAVFLLTVFLSPEEYGIFFVVDATVGFLVYFSDVGLAAALIQKKKVTKKDLATTFTIQQILVVTLVILAFIFSRQVSNFFSYGPEAMLLLQVLVVSFFLSSLKTIPSILLERDLEFNKLVIPQILETLAFYGAAVYFAWQGWGVRSFTIAVGIRAVIGLISIYILKPWVPQFGLDKNAAKSLLSFGAPFQLNSILALFKDKLMIIFLGKVLGPAQIGLLGWAEKWALMPIRFFADPVLKVTFPAYSRLQDKPKELKKAIEKSIFFVALLVFPAVIGMIVLAPSLVRFIPKYAKWEPALVALGFYGINALFSSISITLTNTLNATGKVKTTLKLMVMWTVLTWILTPILLRVYGYNGVAIASALTASSSMIAYWLVNRIVKIQFWPQIFVPLISSFAMGGGVFFISKIYATSLVSTLGCAVFGGILYFIIIFVVAKEKMMQELATVKKYVGGR